MFDLGPFALRGGLPPVDGISVAYAPRRTVLDGLPVDAAVAAGVELWEGVFGPGWALVGDAGYTKDPCTAQGVSDAFRHAEWLTEAVHDGLSGRRPMPEALAGGDVRRDARRPRTDRAFPRRVRRQRHGGRVLRRACRRRLSSGRIAAVLTGWEPETPVTDTLLRRSVFALAGSWEPAVAAMGGRVRRCAEFALADLGRPAGLANAVTLLRPLPYPPDPVLDAVEAEVSGGTGTVCLVSAWPTPDLTTRDWQLLGHPPLHLRPAGPLPAVPPPTGLRITPVADAAAVRDFERVLVTGYPFPDVTPGTLFDERLLTASGPHLEIGYLGGRAVTVGARHTAYGLVVLALGATLPDARHRGCWAAMVRSRLAAAPDLPAIALFSDDSRPGAERLFDFLPITRFTLWVRQRPA